MCDVVIQDYLLRMYIYVNVNVYMMYSLFNKQEDSLETLIYINNDISG